MTYKLWLSPRAAKYLMGLDRATAGRLLDRMEGLKANPYRARGVKPLTGRLSGRYRLRVGSYRIIYRVHDTDQSINVSMIGPRGSIYR